MPTQSQAIKSLVMNITGRRAAGQRLEAFQNYHGNATFDNDDASAEALVFLLRL